MLKALVMAVLSAFVASSTSAHDPNSFTDTHRYVAPGWIWPVMTFESCKWDEDHGGALPFTGIGGECFETSDRYSPADVAPGTGFRIVVNDDNTQNVGFRIRTEEDPPHQTIFVGCGEYPPDGGFAPLPPGTFRIWVLLEATEPFLLLQGCRPATTGTVTLTISP